MDGEPYSHLIPLSRTGELYTMTDFVRVQPGAVNSAGASDALFLKVFGGEVMTAFLNNTVFDKRQTVRIIKSGKSASFPATGRLVAKYHVPGTTLLGQAMHHNERTITIDELLVSDTFISKIEEAKAHWDVRAPLSEQMGDALAQAYDKNVAQVGVLAARSAAIVTGVPGGSVINGGATIATDATVLAGAIWTAAQTLDEKYVPNKARSLFVRPAQFYLAAKTNSLINKDWDGKGSYGNGTIESIAGITFVKTNNLPSTSIVTGPTPYQGDFTNTIGLVATPDAMGTVKLLDLAIEAEWQIRERGHFMVAEYAVGHGILRAEAAVEISKGV